MKQAFYSLLSLVLLAGCSSEAPYPDVPDREPVPLTISSIQIESDVPTRAGDTPLLEGTLGLYRTGGPFYTPASFRYTGTGGHWSSPVPLTLGAAEAFVCAWFPADYFAPPAVADLARFPLQAQVYTPAGDLAFLPATGGLDRDHPALNVRLTHAYSLLRFTLRRDVSYTGAGTVTAVTFENERFVRTETIDIRDGSLANPEFVKRLPLNVTATVPAGGTATLLILIPPQTFPDTRLTLEVDGQTLSGTFSGSSIGELQSGMSRSLDVILRRNLGLSVSVLPVDGSAGGEIEW